MFAPSQPDELVYLDYSIVDLGLQPLMRRTASDPNLTGV